MFDLSYIESVDEVLIDKGVLADIDEPVRIYAEKTECAA